MNPTVEAVLILQLDAHGQPNHYDSDVIANAFLCDSNNNFVASAQSLSNPAASPSTALGRGSSSIAYMYFRWPNMTVNELGNGLKLYIEVCDMTLRAGAVESAWTDEFNCIN